MPVEAKRPRTASSICGLSVWGILDWKRARAHTNMEHSSAVPIYTETGISRELNRNSGACELSRESARMMRVHSRLLHEHGKCLGGLPGHCIRSIRSLYHLSGTSPVSKTSPGFELDNEIDSVVQHQRRSSGAAHATRTSKRFIACTISHVP